MRKRSVFIVPFIVFAAMFVVPGCKKDDDTPPKTTTELLSQDLWKFEKATAGGADISSNIDACIKDNTIIFNSDGTGEVVENNITCTPSSASDFVWTFQNNNSRLFVSTVIFPGGGNEFNVVTLNDNNLELSQQVTIPPAPATTVIVTLSH